MASEHLNGPQTNLTFEGLISADQQLLAGLASRIERTADLRATERTIIEQAAVFTGKGNALSDALINDVNRGLC